MAIGQYVSQTNDHTVLAAGAFRVVIECARFYQSLSLSIRKTNDMK
jgi:trehalose/maltose hydrolase-like predicted phosphorylase